MSNKIQIIKGKLDSVISQLCKTAWMFVKDPFRDFTRERKLPFPNFRKGILFCNT